MKVFNQIRYVLFAVILLGLFANLAQNEYGLGIIYISEFLIGSLFIFEAFQGKRNASNSGKARRFFDFSEHFLAGVLFIAFAGLPFSFTGGVTRTVIAFRLLLLFGGPLLFLLYFVYGLRNLITEFRKGVALAVIVFFYTLASGLVALGIIYQPLAMTGPPVFRLIAIGISLILMILALFRFHFKYGPEKITVFQRLRRVHGKIPILFFFFLFWSVHLLLVTNKFLPSFYNTSKPVAFKKMRERDVSSERLDAYFNNYCNFLANRKAAESK
jgi:hypothetical protein